MKIIIAGAGEVGYHLSKLLSYESHEITLIDQDKERLIYADTRLDIKTMQENATSIECLKNAGIAEADLLIAVTASETTNIAICVIAKQLGAKKTVARISNVELIENKDEVNFKGLGIDELISTEELAAEEIKILIDKTSFQDTHNFEDGALTMIGMKISKTAPIVGLSVKQSASQFQDFNFIPVAIKHKDSQETIIPRGDTVFGSEDIIYFITTPEGVAQIQHISGFVAESIKDVMILGGGRIGSQAAIDLTEMGFNVKLIERDKNKAISLGEKLTDTLVIYGDGRDLDLLKEENVDEMDAFVAVTGRSETNIMACLVAKSKGVKRTIALVENIDFFKLSKDIGIDTLINKKVLAANSIFRYIRKGDVLEMTILNNVDAEILEFNVHENSKITKKIIREHHFPREAIIGGVIRNGKGIIPLGDFLVLPDDKVIVCCLPNAVPKVEKYFN
jgi:trk system potassium uptake protein TrkA